MKKKDYPFWIKQRYNPQLGVYYVGCGQMSKTAAIRMRGSLYGSNVMLRFETEGDYNARLEELKATGEKVQ